MTSQSSPDAYASLQAAAESIQGTLGPAIQINISKNSKDGNIFFTQEDNGTLAMTVGIPASFRQDGAKYAIAKVNPGGKYEIFRDTDSDPNTVSFPAQAGFHAYALVRTN